MIINTKFLKRSASSAGMWPGASGIVSELVRRTNASSNALMHSFSPMQGRISSSAPMKCLSTISLCTQSSVSA
ncbi:hypothetical protein BC826DRAFT_165920 [Russula brevipes]|nr:hypothetical protein BC826DRAFT_165920 [Russula brevipes]